MPAMAPTHLRNTSGVRFCQRRWSTIAPPLRPAARAAAGGPRACAARAAALGELHDEEEALHLQGIVSTDTLQAIHRDGRGLSPAAAALDEAEEEDAEAGSERGAQPGAGSDGGEFPTLQLSLPEPTHSRVRTATFMKSSTKLQECPPVRFPEFAVIGRSNVGKSSLINMLTGFKGLALVSKEPGGLQATRLLRARRRAGPPGRRRLGLGLAALPSSSWRLQLAAACRHAGADPGGLPRLPRRQDALHQPLPHQPQLAPG
jgi:hypothetical protein